MPSIPTSSPENKSWEFCACWVSEQNVGYGMAPRTPDPMPSWPPGWGLTFFVYPRGFGDSKPNLDSQPSLLGHVRPGFPMPNSSGSVSTLAGFAASGSASRCISEIWNGTSNFQPCWWMYEILGNFANIQYSVYRMDTSSLKWFDAWLSISKMSSSVFGLMLSANCALVACWKMLNTFEDQRISSAHLAMRGSAHGKMLML